MPQSKKQQQKPTQRHRSGNAPATRELTDKAETQIDPLSDFAVGSNQLHLDTKRMGTILHLQRTIGNRAVTELYGDPVRQGNTEPAIAHTINNTGLLQRGEAPVHQGIEETATEALKENVSEEDYKRLLKQMYAGNWMRDFSQFNLPMPHSIVSKLPKDIADPTGEDIGAEGAEDIVTATIRSLAYMHFGEDITDELVTPENIGKYTPEQHVDNPMGTTAANHLIRDSDSGLLRPGVPQVSSEAPADERAQLAGKAFPGLQTENPALFEVSDAGLTKHIYNAIEWVKDQLGAAVQAGQSPKGRMYLGSALHAVEDYFAHSNFIEVALNSEIDRVASSQFVMAEPDFSHDFLRQAEENRDPETGLFVDTLYDETGADGRQAVTTGTAGSEDLKVSMGQIILPKLPALSKVISKKIDEALYLVEESEGKTTWEAIQEKLKSDEGGGGHAFVELVNALDKHIQVPAYDIELTKRWIPFTDRFIPTGWKTSVSSKGVVAAIRHYIRLYESIQFRLDEIESVVDTVLFPISWIVDLKEKAMQLIKSKIAEVKKMVMREVNMFLLSLAEEITGYNFQKEKDIGIEYALDFAATQGVEHIRSGTSIESQLPQEMEKMKGDPVGLYQKYGVVDGKEQFALPPSHSEISKDHPPHEDEDHNPRDSLKGYDVSEGSLFYQLHHNLAVEADKHIIKKLQEAWDAQTQSNSAEGMATDPSVNPEDVMDEARQHQEREQERAEKEGRTLQTYAHEGPETQDLMALVDYFIAHPEDTSWWKPILTEYVNNNEEEVINHIKQRNQTRDIRQ